jgi:cation diffusion facilitator family transporter
MSSGAKQTVALSSVFASLLMAAMKLAAGTVTGSLALLSEGAHSLLDLGTASLTWVAVRVGDQPADDRHPYGHGKFESVSALVGTALLFLTAAGIAWEAVDHLLSPPRPIPIPWYSIAVILVSMAIDIGRSRALARVAKATSSQALEADALHFSSDILASAAVLVGLGLVHLGWARGDAVAALAVSGFIAHAGWDLGRRTLDVLVDAAPDGLMDRISTVTAAIPGVAQVEQVRARPVGPTTFIELVVKVSRTLPFEQVEIVRAQIEEALRSELGEIQILVAAEPLALNDETIAETVRVLAAGRGLSVHNIGVATVDSRPHVSFDLEVDDRLTLAAAHALASDLEAALRDELGADLAIDIHIDPRRHHVFQGTSVEGATLATVRQALARALAAYPLAESAHDLCVQQRDDGVYVSCHCLFPDQAPIGDVHDVTERIEHLLMRSVPGIARAVVHAEPASHPDEDYDSVQISRASAT